MAWICADRPLNGHDLTFKALHRSLANISYVTYFPAFEWLLRPLLRFTTFEISSPSFAVTVEYIRTVIYEILLCK